MPALQVLEAAGTGTVEVSYTAPYYYVGKDPSMTFGTALPFGLNSRQMWSWLYHAGGRQMLEPVWRDQGVHGITAGNTGAQMGGWFRREIRSVQDLQGLKFRIGGIGGQIFQKVGAVAQQLGGADIYPALERGVIDGAEWVGPYDDEKLGFNRIAQFSYSPAGGSRADDGVHGQPPPLGSAAADLQGSAGGGLRRGLLPPVRPLRRAEPARAAALDS